MGYYVGTFVAEIVLGFFATAIVMWFSRWREFHADAGSAKLTEANKMIAALQRLQMAQAGQLPDQLAAFGIHGSKGSSLIQRFFRSHPPIEDRIAALQQNRY